MIPSVTSASRESSEFEFVGGNHASPTTAAPKNSASGPASPVIL